MGRLNRLPSSPNVRLRRESAGHQHGWQWPQPARKRSLL